MHPFYGPSGRLVGGRGSDVTGLVSMAAYLAFWAGALVIGMRELNARFPRVPGPSAQRDPALAVLRERYARGELDREQFLAMLADLAVAPKGPR